MDTKALDVLLAAAEPLIELAVAEDIGPGDATSIATLPRDAILSAHIVAKAAGVIAGLPVAEAVFRRVDPVIRFTARVSDGQEVVPGEVIAEVQGPGPSLLAAERTVLNFLQRMSGIATHTRDFVDAVATTRATILDTRKTLPGYRVLDKYAVRMGGGANHRMGLYDMMLVKDNHIDASGGITKAVERARARYANLPIEVEVRTLEELHEALDITPPLDRILLDNMDLATLREAVAIVTALSPHGERGGERLQVPLEASGNITLDRVAAVAATGVDYISVGALTHSVRALDLSMKISKPGDTQEGEKSLEFRVQTVKAALGERLVILGHHYQRDTVIAFADFRGDSLQLSRNATETDAEFIVFCGVHFMAETAAILAKPDQHVLIPDPTAGCYLADTATPAAVQAAWEALDAHFGDAEALFTPITYVNSSAELKAFCGKHGGAICTSGNAEAVLRWALKQRPRVFFFPDQHLGRNTARRMGIPLEKMYVWPGRGSDTDAARLEQSDGLEESTVILWPGACNVHQRFRPEHVLAVRERYPDIRVMVHPECPMAVVELADDAGSTAQIIKAVGAAPAGSRWAIGTETRLVRRLQQEHPEQMIIPLADVPPFCATMGQITLENLAAVLETLPDGFVPYGLAQSAEVKVAPDIARWASVALERMLAL